MFNVICPRENCSGCATCFSICPKKCIKMVHDEEGFLRPLIDEEQCVHCDLCKMTCPINHPPLDDRTEPRSFAARVKDKEILLKSSSGGLFSACAMQVLDKGGVVIAASFDGSNQISHKICKSRETLDELRRSKYVQSAIGTTYIESKKMLEAGHTVLFCGTPCQIGGLKAYLGKDYETLYTIDFVCHGTPSPLAYNRYLEYLTEKYKSNVKEVNFRSKIRGWHTHSLSVSFENGHEYNESLSQDYYMRSFIMDMNLRQSCYHCSFKQVHRTSDITLADFWGVERIIPHWNEDSGVSLVMIHSEKGLKLFDSCGEMIECMEVPFSDAIRNNPSFKRSVKKPPLRDAFMKDLNKIQYDKLHKKYCSSNLSSKLRRKIAKVISRKT